MSRYSKRNLQYLPISLQNFLSLVLSVIILFPILYFWFEPVFILGLGLSSSTAALILLLSLFGSYFNIPILELLSYHPIVKERYVHFFGFSLIIPNLVWEEQKTIVTINVGGALIPILFSIYLFVTHVLTSVHPFLFLTKVVIATLLVTYLIHKIARPIRGIGIAMPGIFGATITAVISIIIASFGEYCNVTVIAYIAGTLGALIGADFLNLKKIPELGAPVVSIGGAGTFDGVFLNGLFSILLILLFV